MILTLEKGPSTLGGSEFIPALEKVTVIETNRDQGTLERTRRYIQTAKEG